MGPGWVPVAVDGVLDVVVVCGVGGMYGRFDGGVFAAKVRVEVEVRAKEEYFLLFSNARLRLSNFWQTATKASID